jgi:hypothetical protein
MTNGEAQLWHRIDRHGERLDSHESRLSEVSHRIVDLATRDDVREIRDMVERMGREIRSDISEIRTNDRTGEREFGIVSRKLADRIGKLEGGSNTRGAAAGLGGGLLLLLLTILAKLLGVEIPTP